MTGIREWAFSICAAAVVAAIVQMISPAGALKKSVMTVLNLFVLLCVLAPLSGLALDRAMPDFYDNGYQIGGMDPQKTAEQIYESAISSELRAVVLDKLAAMGINDADARINITVNEGGMEIESVLILLPEQSKDRGDEVEKRLTEELELTIVIANDQEVKK